MNIQNIHLYGYGTKCRWVNDDRVLICGWTTPLKHERRPRWVFTPTQAYHVQERHVFKLCAPELVLHVMRQFTLSSDFYFKAIQSIKTGRERNRWMAKTQGRRVLSPTRISPTHREQSHPWGLQRWHERDSLPYFSWSLWTITALQKTRWSIL